MTRSLRSRKEKLKKRIEHERSIKRSNGYLYTMREALRDPGDAEERRHWAKQIRENRQLWRDS